MPSDTSIIESKFSTPVVLSILEITSGCVYALENRISIPMICFLFSFGGMCTHLQIASILEKVECSNQNIIHHFFNIH